VGVQTPHDSIDEKLAASTWNVKKLNGFQLQGASP